MGYRRVVMILALIIVLASSLSALHFSAGTPANGMVQVHSMTGNSSRSSGGSGYASFVHNLSVESGIDSYNTGTHANPITMSTIASPDIFSTVSSGSSGYAVFNESGLPTGASWFVAVGGHNYTGYSTMITVKLLDGNYTFTTGTESGYSSRVPKGTISVNGGRTMINVSFESSLSVKFTLFLQNGTIRQGNQVYSNSTSSPMGVLVDPYNNLTYVTDTSLDRVYAINAGGTITARIQVGVNPSMLAYDPVNGYLYVTNSGSDNISVIGHNNSVISSIAVGDYPFGISYDPADKALYVSNVFSGNISVVASQAQNGAGSVSETIQLPSGVMPFSSVYDGMTGSVYFTNINGNNIYSVTGNRVTGSITVRGPPTMITYDSLNGNLYSTSSQTSATTGYGYISVINYTQGMSVANIETPALKNPFAISYDKNRNVVYVSGANYNRIVEFNPNTQKFINSIQVGAEPYGLALAPSGNSMWVTNFNSGTVSFLGYLPPVAPISFSESGLPHGTSWNVSLAGTTLSSTSSVISFEEIPGNYTYTVSRETGYLAHVSGSSLVFEGAARTVNVTYMKLYTASVKEHGLPSGAAWQFTMGGNFYSSTENLIQARAVNGTYTVSPTMPSGIYSSPPESFTVSGSNISVSVYFHYAYGVKIRERGLSLDTEWSVQIGDHNLSGRGSSLSLNLSNGTYHFSVIPLENYTSSPLSGNITVSGAAQTINIEFTELFRVSFTEHGLPYGNPWHVNITGKSLSSYNGSVSLMLENGTYPFTTANETGYLNMKKTGYISVSGSSVEVYLTYRKFYSVDFEESGLTQNTSWSVRINGTLYGPLSGSFSLDMVNGSYSYSIRNLTNYVVASPTGILKVAGSNVTVTVAFSPREYLINFTEYNVPQSHTWYIMIDGHLHESAGQSVTVQLSSGIYVYNAYYRLYNTNISVSGVLAVNNGGRNVSVYFPALYHITFKETGLKNGASWTVNISGDVVTSTNSTLTFLFPNGTFNFSINDSSGQDFHIGIHYPESGDDASVSPYWNSGGVKGLSGSSVYSLLINGHDVTAKVNFNQAGHKNQDHSHHWFSIFSSVRDAMIRISLYVEGIIQSVVTSISPALVPGFRGVYLGMMMSWT